MKKLSIVGVMSVVLAAGVYAATDFSSMSTEQLSAMRGTVATEERAAFQAEMQSRMSQLSPADRAALGVGQRGAAAGTSTSAGAGTGVGAGGSAQGAGAAAGGMGKGAAAGGMGAGGGMGRGGR